MHPVFLLHKRSKYVPFPGDKAQNIPLSKLKVIYKILKDEA